MRRYFTALVLVCACAVPARAQESLLRDCAGALPSRGVPGDVVDQFQALCAQVVNAFSDVQPSVGIAFSGGNPVLGTGTTLGNRLGFLPRISVTARMNVAFAKVPALFDGYSAQIVDGATRIGALESVGAPLASVQGDVAIGVFDGLSFGPALGGLGAIDLLGSVAMVPKYEKAGLSDAITNIGVGARLGLLRQGLIAPGISVSAMYRHMSEVSFGDLTAGDPGSFVANLRTTSLRAVVSKGILALDFAVGAGYDRYTSDLDLQWRLTCATSECRSANGGQAIALDGTIENELTTAAWNVFGNVGLDLLFLNLVGEIGYQKPTSPLTIDDLRDAGLPNQPYTLEDLGGGRLFGSLGLRISL